MKKPTTLSYAAWNPKNISDLEWPVEHKKKNPLWIIVGLNPSKPISFPENFHVGKYDYWHRHAFTQEDIIGVPMLDLIDEANPKSAAIVEKWKKDIHWREAQIRRFVAEIKSLFGKHKPKLLCIGKNTNSLFKGEQMLADLFSQRHAILNPNGIRVNGAKQKYAKMVRRCTSSFFQM